MAHVESESLALVHQAYRRLIHSELVLFLLVRNLPISGSDTELASRLAHHDFQTYNFPHALPLSPASPTPTPAPKQRNLAPDLPVEILADIMDHVGDWELARAVGVPTSLSRPLAWSRASSTDEAMLTGYLPLIRAADPITHPPTLGADLSVRFGYVNVLEFFLLESARTNDGTVFKKIYKNDLIPIKASLHGRLGVLSWWKHGFEHHPDLIPAPSPGSIAQALHNASSHGRVEVLDWWLNSGLQLIFDQEALIGATRYNRPEVLEWWDKSQLPIKYRLVDIEEALEDAIGGGEAAREWWRGKGVDEITKSQLTTLRTMSLPVHVAVYICALCQTIHLCPSVIGLAPHEWELPSNFLISHATAWQCTKWCHHTVAQRLAAQGPAAKYSWIEIRRRSRGDVRQRFCRDVEENGIGFMRGRDVIRKKREGQVGEVGERGERDLRYPGRNRAVVWRSREPRMTVGRNPQCQIGNPRKEGHATCVGRQRIPPRKGPCKGDVAALPIPRRIGPWT